MLLCPSLLLNVVGAWKLQFSLQYVGDVPTFDHFLSDNAANLHQVNSKNGQQMGATVYSAGDVFVVRIVSSLYRVMCI